MSSSRRSASPPMQDPPRIKSKPKRRYRTPSPLRPISPIGIEKMSARQLEEEEEEPSMQVRPKIILKLRCRTPSPLFPESPIDMEKMFARQFEGEEEEEPSMHVPVRIILKPKLRYSTPPPRCPDSPLDIEKMPARKLGEEELMDFNPKHKLRCLLFNHLHVKCFLQKSGLLLDPKDIIFSAEVGKQEIYRLWIPHDSEEITFQKTLAQDLGDEFVGGGVEISISTAWNMLANGLVEFAVIASAKAFSKTIKELEQEVLEVKWWVDESKFTAKHLIERLSEMEIVDVQKLIAYVAKWKFDKNGKPRSDKDAMMMQDLIDPMWAGETWKLWGWIDDTVPNENDTVRNEDGASCE